MKNKKKVSNIIRFLIGIVLGILTSVVGVYATTIIGEGSNLTYDNTKSGLSSTNIQDALDELKETLNCPEGKICYKNPLKLGDYVFMTPTKSSYTTDKSKTGHTESQTINPQELNLWRVISINGDGTVDMISEYVSSTEVYFQGLIGYQNLVGYLNVLASQYENSKYTKGSRHFGYNGQTEYITDTSKFTYTAPWTCSMKESCNSVESQGGGDTGYIKDYNLVKNALGVVKAGRFYWVASRLYLGSPEFGYSLHARIIDENSDELSLSGMYENNGTDASETDVAYSIRPILTLKYGLKYSGSGTEDDPYKLSN